MSTIEDEITELKRLTNTARIVDLSKALGVTSSTVQTWKHRNKIPEYIFLKAQKIHFDCEIPFGDSDDDFSDFVVTSDPEDYGNDDVDAQIEILKKLTKTTNTTELSTALNVSISEIQRWKCRGKIPDHISSQISDSSKTYDSMPSGFIQLPFYDIEVSAGHGTLVACEERSEDMVFSQRFVTDTLGVKANNIFLMPVRGDSMVPTLKNQSLIIVNRTDQLIEDGVYVFRYDGQLRVKRLQFSKIGITVVSDNPAYKTWELSKAELATEDFEIIGEVIWSGQKM